QTVKFFHTSTNHFLAILVALTFLLRVNGEAPRVGYCIGKQCFAVFQDQANFGTAQKRCEENNDGYLMTVRSLISHSILLILLGIHTGDYWIGLQLPSGQCPDQASFLRGYRWITGGNETTFQNWGRFDDVCSSKCISVSKYDFVWKEQPCDNKIDGFICEYKLVSPCPNGYVFENDKCVDEDECSMGPCEHECTNTIGSYNCSCWVGFKRMTEDTNRCQLVCFAECIAECDPSTPHHCNCPNGYLLDDKNGKSICVDIDECEMGECHHNCTNTYGGYLCSCDEGFDLVGLNDCVEREASNGSGFTIPFTPFVKHPTERPSTVKAGGLLGIIVCIVIVIFVMVVLIHLILKRRGNLDIIFYGIST
uniref:Thrombomodulin n=1 Tax=Salmo trutta TaxID=8032 RepID=A0A673X1V6_SALTR